MVVAVLAVAALIWRRSARRGVGLIAAPTFLAVAFLVGLLPDRVALLVPLNDAVWAAAHDRWTVTLVAASAIALAASTWSGPAKARFTV